MAPNCPPTRCNMHSTGFWRADASRVGPKAGLSIVAAIAQSHGGTAIAANHPDGGAIFTIELPVASDSDSLVL